MKHGILLIDKPKGHTSNDAVQVVRKALHERAIGHLGTLDPQATGLLVLFIGKKALKTIELFTSAEKEYEASILCGKTSSTYDHEGVIDDVPAKAGWEPPTERKLLALLRNHFSGTITQRPPAHSAVHIAGQRAYELIRKDPKTSVMMPEREVTITDLQLLSYAYPHIKLRIACSSGTYIRSIANDLGVLLRCGAFLDGLRRTRVGTWDLNDAHPLKKIAWAHVIPLKEILAPFPRHDLTEEEWEDVSHGRRISVTVKEEPLIAWYKDLPVAILERRGEEAGPRKVL